MTNETIDLTLEEEAAVAANAARAKTERQEQTALLARINEIVRRGTTDPARTEAAKSLHLLNAAVKDLKAAIGAGTDAGAFDEADGKAVGQLISKLRARAREIVEAHS